MYTDMKKQSSSKFQNSFTSESFVSVITTIERNPDDWITGTEPMSDAQKFYIKYLCDELGETFYGNLSKMQASKYINELNLRTGRKSLSA